MGGSKPATRWAQARPVMASMPAAKKNRFSSMTRPSPDSVMSDVRKFFTGAITTATFSLADVLMPSSDWIVMLSTITCACKAPGCMAVPGPEDAGGEPRQGRQAERQRDSVHKEDRNTMHAQPHELS